LGSFNLPRKWLVILVCLVIGTAAILFFRPWNEPDDALEIGSNTKIEDKPIDTATLIQETSESSSDLAEKKLSTSGEKLGTFTLWSEVEIPFKGPSSSGLSVDNNPFQVDFAVTFFDPAENQIIVPGFYQGDDQGGMDGDIWLVRFSPDSLGEWRYRTSSSQELLDGHSGVFEVVTESQCEDGRIGDYQNFECLGRLTYTGQHYLSFSDGTAWLKGGVNEPEDFLAPGVNAGFANKEAAIDFLAEHKVNSVYLVLHNINGDGKNVWPWHGSTQGEAKRNTKHFDIGKLQEWEGLFDYLQDKGIVLHLVLEDDSAWTGFDRQVYYREMVARFAHHQGIIWNISEEFNENYSPDEIKQYAKMLRDLDPYDHPITVHHAGRTSQWQPFLGDENIDLTSFQTESAPQNEQAVYWFGQSEAEDKTIPISFDETGQLDSHEVNLARRIVWSVYLGGANIELFTNLNSGYLEFEPFFSDMGRAREFIEKLPFDSMAPCNELLQPEGGYCFGKPGEVYVVYFPTGGSLAIDLTDMEGDGSAVWFDPRTGGTIPAGRIGFC
jgi:hypothetical protein